MGGRKDKKNSDQRKEKRRSEDEAGLTKGKNKNNRVNSTKMNVTIPG